MATGVLKVNPVLFNLTGTQKGKSTFMLLVFVFVLEKKLSGEGCRDWI